MVIKSLSVAYVRLPGLPPSPSLLLPSHFFPFPLSHSYSFSSSSFPLSYHFLISHSPCLSSLSLSYSPCFLLSLSLFLTPLLSFSLSSLILHTNLSLFHFSLTSLFLSSYTSQSLISISFWIFLTLFTYLSLSIIFQFFPFSPTHALLICLSFLPLSLPLFDSPLS